MLAGGAFEFLWCVCSALGVVTQLWDWKAATFSDSVVSVLPSGSLRSPIVAEHLKGSRAIRTMSHGCSVCVFKELCKFRVPPFFASCRDGLVYCLFCMEIEELFVCFPRG